MRENRKKTIKYAVLVLILLLGIGYAALTAKLKVDGTVHIDKATWDVHFENVEVTEGSVTANPAPTTNNVDTTSMTYTINFTKPGDFYEFTVDVVNDGTIDAMVSLVTNNAYANASSTTPITLPSYLTSTVTYDDGVPINQNQLLAKETSEKIKVRVEFKKDISASDLPSSGDTTVVFKFKGNFKQADETAIKRIYNYKTRQIDNEITPNDEICISNECFYVVSTNETTTVLLAKYALDTNLNKQTDVTSGGSRSPYYTYYGFCKDGKMDYWKNKVGEDLDYPGSYEDPNYPEVYDDNSDLYIPTEAYKNYFVGLGATITKARQLKYNEVKEMCGGLDCSSNTIITVNQHFYLNTAYNDISVWSVNYSGSVSRWTNGSGGVGIRPAFEIPTTEFKH